MLDATFIDRDVVGPALAGLTATPKTLPPFLLYDAAGVALFEKITRLPEYYVTRTELALLDQVAGEIAGLAETASVLVEYGASDEAKAARLLDAAPAKFHAYMPIDVAAGAMEAMARRLRLSHPRLRVHPFCGDFLRPIVLPDSVRKLPRFGFFPGSTIGNLDPEGARAFLKQAALTLGEGAWLIVGVDLRKDENILVPAYDDAQGVTAAFNLNLLHRLNREAGADFDPRAFAHRAIWNAKDSRIEMHLESLRPQRAHLAGVEIRFAAGETIHTENSYKHTVGGFQSLAESAGWRARHVWVDRDGLFSIHALCAGGARS
jgi:dimethylhistidine N-methyltransferase